MGLNKKLFIQGETGAANAANFNTVIYTGSGSAQSITGVGFQPDLVWAKTRTYSSATSHRLVDSVRGATKEIYSDLDNAQATDANGITSFDSDGFSFGGNHGSNLSSAPSVAWCWKGGGAAVSNTDGTRTSSVSANTASGFSIVKWTSQGDNAIRTVGHGLGAVPKLIFLKSTEYSSTRWWVYTSITGTNKALRLDTNANEGPSVSYWSTPTTTTFGIKESAITGSNSENIAYCFADVTGVQSIGTYTGNGNSNGPTITTGFQPRFVLVKLYDTGYTSRDWLIWDTVRDTNLTGNEKTLSPNTSGNEVSAQNEINILSNGFQIADPFPLSNTTGGDYIYWAIA